MRSSTQTGSRARFSPAKKTASQLGSGGIHAAYLRDRTSQALDYAIAAAEERESIRQQHGPVRVIMVGGKPGPDGAR